MPPEKESLYGKARSKKNNNEQTASNLNFTSQLSSLIAQGSTASSSQGRQRPSKTPKSDIFATHNKGSQKRAASDLNNDNRAVKQVHRNTKDIGSIDTAALGRSRRRMEEKVKMYDDMKKGRHLAGDSSDDDDMPIDPSDPDAYMKRLRRKEKEGLVDFDLKHSNEQDLKHDVSDGDSASIVSYEDEFGRSRRGTRAEAAEASRAKDEEAGGNADQERWRPARPDNIIYGEAVQTEAFNPDASIASKMSKLASRRDRSPTPEYKHYDAEAEVRNRGTGFYGFSADEEERKKQMEQLKIMRDQTILKRESVKEQMAKRKANEEWRLGEIKKIRIETSARRAAQDREKELNPPPPPDPNDLPDPTLHFLPHYMQKRSWVPKWKTEPRRLWPEKLPWFKESEEPDEPKQTNEPKPPTL